MLTENQLHVAVVRMITVLKVAEQKYRDVMREKQAGKIRKFTSEEMIALFRRANESYVEAKSYRASIGEPVPEYVPNQSRRNVRTIGRLKLVRYAA